MAGDVGAKGPYPGGRRPPMYGHSWVMSSSNNVVVAPFSYLFIILAPFHFAQQKLYRPHPLLFDFVDSRELFSDWQISRILSVISWYFVPLTIESSRMQKGEASDGLDTKDKDSGVLGDTQHFTIFTI